MEKAPLPRPLPHLETLLGPDARDFSSQNWPNEPRLFKAEPKRMDWLLDAIPRDLSQLSRYTRLRLRAWWINQNGDFQQTQLTQENLQHRRPEATVVVDRLEEAFPHVGRFLRSLGSELAIPLKAATASFYVSNKNQSTRVHYDQQEVFLHQVEGEKTWHYSKCEEAAFPDRPNFGPSSASRDGGITLPTDLSDFETVTLLPGDILFLPRGWWHQSLALSDSYSLTWTLWCMNKAEQLLEQLYPVLREEASARMIASPANDINWDEMKEILRYGLAGLPHSD